MRDRRLLALFFYHLVAFGIGSGMLPLMPVYAIELGASPRVAGAYVAGSFLAVAAGTMLSNRMALRLGSRRRLLIAAATICIPAHVLMGQADTVATLAALNAAAWFCGGATGATVNVLTGLYAHPERRGRTFALMHLSVPVGTIVGGLSIGALADGLGYPTTFAILGLAWVLPLALSAVVLPADRLEEGPRTAGASPSASLHSAPFAILLLATLLFSTAIFVGRMGTSLAMQALSFGATPIAATVVAGSIATLPLLPVAGALSDRLGRGRLLLASYALAAAGVALLAGATDLWRYLAGAALISVGTFTSTSTASALTADLLPQAALGRGLPLLNTAGWAAAVVGYGAGGALVPTLGLDGLYGGAVGLIAGAAALVIVMRRAGPEARPATAGGSAAG